MSDRRAITAERLAPAAEAWRVSVGGDLVQEMTVDQIRRAFQTGELKLRTPLWPPGASGWQALGNFSEFKVDSTRQLGSGAAQRDPSWSDDGPDDRAAPSGVQVHDADGSPTRLQRAPGPVSAPYPTLFSSRPTQLRSPRAAPLAILNAPAHIQQASSPIGLQHGTPSALPEFRPRRGGLWLVVAAVALAAVAVAVVSTSGSSRTVKRGEPAQVATPASAAKIVEPVAAPQAPAPPPSPVSALPRGGAIELASHDDGKVVPEVQSETAAAAQASPTSVPETKANARKWRRTPAGRASTGRKRPSPAAPASAPPAADEAALIEPSHDTPDGKNPDPALEATKAAAAKALAEATVLAASCNPRGGPSGTGKARVIYAPSGTVRSVEIMTEKFRDTVTASCVRMVYRRAKIPAFQGEALSFMKAFTIPPQ